MDDSTIGQRALRIGMLIPYDLSEVGGGVKVHAMQLADALRRGGDEVTIFGPSSVECDTPSGKGFSGVINIVSNGSDNRIGVGVSPWAVRRFLSRCKFDVLHIHEPLTPMLPFYAAWFAWNLPKVATFHAYSERSSRALLVGRFLIAPLILPSITRGIAVSPAAARHALINYRGPLTQIPNGIETSLFSQGGYSESRSHLNLLFVGRTTDSRKGYRYLAAAVQRCRSRGLDISLCIVGERSTNYEVIDGIEHLGPRDEAGLARAYRDCDVFVAPSTGQESFGIVLLEAMASGRPVICSDIEGYRMAANPEGTRWVAPRDVDALVCAIEDLLFHPEERRRLGMLNLSYVRRFDWTALVPAIRDEYLHACSLNGNSTASSAHSQVKHDSSS